MSAAILCIGTELTRGEIVNSNATWLAEALTVLGLEVTASECVPDDRPRLEAALARLGREHDVVVATGGLGPTTDDFTAECVARVLGVPLERDAASLHAITERMARFGRTMAASNAKQADFPRGATILPNPNGTAPGFAVTLGRAQCFFMPGVPREMRPMFDEQVATRLLPALRDRAVQIRLRTFGMTESAVNDALTGIEREFDVVVAYRAHFPEIEVKPVARAATPELAAARVRRAADAIRERLGSDVVFGEGEVTLAESVGQLLVQRGLWLGVAESCTGGLLSELLTERSGASAYYAGGVVAYSNRVKRDLLGVDEALLAQHGAVSAEVAEAMARGARRALGTDYALAITGVAGPSGGTPEKPVGLVFLALDGPRANVVKRLEFPGTRAQIQRLSAFTALAMLRRALMD